MHKAAAQGQFRTASAIGGGIINLLRATGGTEEALALVEKVKDFRQRAGLGPWTQLADEGRRLQLLHALGRSKEVLHAVEALQTHMRALPEESHMMREWRPGTWRYPQYCFWCCWLWEVGKR